MKIAKITRFKDGKCTVMLKNSLIGGEWYWGDAFDNQPSAINYTKSEHCIFTLVVDEK